VTVVRTNLLNWASTYDDNSIAAERIECLRDTKQVISGDVKKVNGVDNRPAVKALRLAKDNKIICKVAVKLGKRRASKLVQEMYVRKTDTT